MIRVSFHELAKRDLMEAIAFYEDNARALELLAHVRRALVRLRRFPLSGRAIRGPVRQVVLSKYPYSLLYSVEAEHIRILAFAHHRREPLYWLDRI